MEEGKENSAFLNTLQHDPLGQSNASICNFFGNKQPTVLKVTQPKLEKQTSKEKTVQQKLFEQFDETSEEESVYNKQRCLPTQIDDNSENKNPNRHPVSRGPIRDFQQ
jgi:hypothetical protein